MSGYQDNFEDIQAARDRVEKRLRNLPNVHAVGIGPKTINGERTDDLAILVYVTNKLSDRELKKVEKVPPKIELKDGSYVSTDVIESDIPSPDVAPRHTEHRPVFGALSGRDSGRSGYGTLGASIEFGGAPATLTNRHVITTYDTEPVVGDEVVQPAGTASVIGTVVEWSDWTGGTASSDSAIVDLNDGVEASNYIASIGALGASESAALGDTYVVSGVRTGVGAARLLDLNYKGVVNYGGTRIEYSNLTVFEGITDSGDSGAVWGRYDRTEEALRPVGLNFASTSSRAWAIPWTDLQAEHSQPISPLSDANASPPQPTATDAAVEVTPITLTTGQRPTLYCLATRWGDPNALPDGSIHLARDADSGGYISSVETSAAWGEPELVGFAGLDIDLDPGFHDVTLHTATESESYTIEVLEPTQYWLGGQVTDANGVPIGGADVQAIPADSGAGTVETTTDADGRFSAHLHNNQYRVLIDHPDYWADDSLVDIDGRSRTHDVTLEFYGDDINIDALLRAAQLTTDQDGKGRFADIVHGEYGLKFSKTGYRTKARSINHDSGGTSVNVKLQAENILNPPVEGTRGQREPPEAGNPVGFDPRISLPDGPAHFECAVLDTDAGDNYEIPILVSNTGGELGATDLRLEVDITGNVLATRDITLVPGGAMVAYLSVRAGIQSMRLPTTMRASTVDDDERFLMTAEYPRPSVVNRGLPTTLAEGATVGPTAPFTAGPMRAPPEPAGLEFPEDGWSLTLERPNGERRVITEVSGDPDIEDTYNELATWSVETPADPSLEQWNFETRAYIARNGRLVTVGWCDDITQTADDETATLSGGGPLHDLIGDEHEIDIHQMVDWRAAQKLVDEVAPDWQIAAVRPTDSVMVRDESYAGNALEILTSFCDDYGFLFRPSKTNFRQATISPPGAVASSEHMDVIEYTEEASSEGYANEVVYRGPDDIKATAEDSVEIRRLAEKLDLRLSEARETVSVSDDRADTQAKAEAKAQAELRDRIQRYEVGGEVTMPARRLQPGVSYPLPTDDEVWHTARSLHFTSNGWVSIPTEMMARLSGSGAIAFAFRADVSDLDSLEYRLLGAWSSPHTVLHTRNATYDFRVKTDTNVARSVSAFETPPADGEWHLYHADWTYEGDETSGLTTIRAGHDGEIVEEETVDGRLDFDDVIQVAIGRVRQDFARGTIVESARFYDAPQSPERYARLARGGSIPATDLVTRYAFDEPPGEDTLTDAVSGYHATINGEVLSAGRPAVLESADHTLAETTAEFDETKTYADLLRGQL